ncbi:MAG: sugar ABC transporter permease [Lachnospiraceae bacterium]|nr:sugar ABC transporter permease [Lachnospiraceae bacterium]
MGGEIVSLLKANIRDYMMYIVLAAIMIFFTVGSGGTFLGGRNITNLFKEAGHVAILAIGMTIILIIRHIDLSVGYVAGFSGAVAALLMTKGISIGSFTIGPVNEWVAILIVLAMGALIGLYQGTVVTKIGVPAFVTTLAGQFIFRGLLLRTTAATGTIVISDTRVVPKDFVGKPPTNYFNQLSNGYIPDLPIELPIRLHLLTVIIGVLMVLAFAWSQLKTRRNKLKYNFAVTSMPVFVLKLGFFAAVIMFFMILLAQYNGLPWVAVIIGVVLLLYNYVLNQTKLGRYVYGIGGNDQAAELSGVNVKRVTLYAFISMSTLAALAGILFTSRLRSASPDTGSGFELDAIASSYIGGVAVSGGIGRVTNTIIGALIITSLTNGMNLMQINISWQYIIKGIIFVIAVAFDVRTRQAAK